MEKRQWKGVKEKLFLPAVYCILKAAFIHPSHHQPRLRNHSANSTHRHMPKKKWPLTVITSLPFGIMQYHFFMHFIATGIYLKRKMKSPKRFPLIIDKVSFMSQLNTEAFLACRTWLELNDLFFFCSAGNQRGTCTGILVQTGTDTRKTNMSIY